MWRISTRFPTRRGDDSHLHSGFEPTTIVWHTTYNTTASGVCRWNRCSLPWGSWMNATTLAGTDSTPIPDFTDTMWLVTPGIYTVTTDNGWNGAEWSEPIRITDPEGRHRTGHNGQPGRTTTTTSPSSRLYKKNDKLRDIVTNALVNNSACSAIANAIGAQQKLAPYLEQDGIPKLTDACSPTFAAFTELDVIGKENTHPDSDGWFDFTVNATGGDAWPSPGTCSQDDWDSWPKAINWFNGLPQGAQQNTGCLLTGRTSPTTPCAPHSRAARREGHRAQGQGQIHRQRRTRDGLGRHGAQAVPTHPHPPRRRKPVEHPAVTGATQAGPRPLP